MLTPANAWGIDYLLIVDTSIPTNQGNIMPSTEVTRTSKGLVETLFDSIDALNDKRIDPEHARAISHTAKTIVSIASLELDVRKFQKEQSSAADAIKSLSIEALPAK